jgi:hypothetical protein
VAWLRLRSEVWSEVWSEAAVAAHAHLGRVDAHELALARAIVDRWHVGTAQPVLGVPRVKRRVSSEAEHPKQASEPVADHQHLHTEAAARYLYTSRAFATQPW